MPSKKMRMLPIAVFGLFLFLGVLPATAQVAGYMKISMARGPVTGASTDEKHRGWIELKSFIDSNPDDTPGSIGVGERQPPKPKSFTVTKYVDSSSDVLQRAAKQNMIVPEIIIDLCKAANCYEQLHMRGVSISSMKVSGEGSDAIETLILSARDVTTQTHEQPSGAEPTPSAPPTATPQIKNNK